MCTALEKKIIHNANRIMICGLSSTGMFMDGIQPWDFPYFLSLALWLGLPECSKVAESALEKTKRVFH